MRSGRIDFTVSIVKVVVMATLIVVSSTATLGQGGMPRSGLPASERNIQAREQQLRAIERPITTKSPEEARLALAQINEDFMRLQAVGHELRTAAATAALDYESVAKGTEELRKRALRLKRNLVFVQSENGQGKKERRDPQAYEKRQAALVKLNELSKGAPDSGQVKHSLTTLVQTIKSFVTNPVFQQANVVDADLSLKASGDLEDMIELSDKLRKLTKKLSEAAKSSP